MVWCHLRNTHTHTQILITGRNEVVAKVIFLHLSHSVHRGVPASLQLGVLVPWGQTPPQWQTPPTQSRLLPTWMQYTSYWNAFTPLFKFRLPPPRAWHSSRMHTAHSLTISHSICHLEQTPLPEADMPPGSIHHPLEQTPPWSMTLLQAHCPEHAPPPWSRPPRADTWEQTPPPGADTSFGAVHSPSLCPRADTPLRADPPVSVTPPSVRQPLG